MPELGRLTRDQFHQLQKHSIILILDNIRSGSNVGSIFRTADAFALERFILCGITPQPPHREILKTALGATDSVPWTYSDDIIHTIQDLQNDNYHVWPIEQTDRSRDISRVAWKKEERFALVFGNEVSGVSEDILGILDESIEIPQFGTKHSLNVAVSAGIVVWHVLNAME